MIGMNSLTNRSRALLSVLILIGFLAPLDAPAQTTLSALFDKARPSSNSAREI
jgi:hypothetical protein